MSTHQNQQNENKKENDYHNNYNNSNTAPGVFITPSDGEKIVHAYNECIGIITGSVAHMIENALTQGLTVDDVVLAINETGFAPRPSAAYLRAILRNWATNGVSVCKAKHYAKKEKHSSWWNPDPENPALKYEQREYRDEDFESNWEETINAYLAKEGKNEPQ